MFTQVSVFLLGVVGSKGPKSISGTWSHVPPGGDRAYPLELRLAQAGGTHLTEILPYSCVFLFSPGAIPVLVLTDVTEFNATFQDGVYTCIGCGITNLTIFLQEIPQNLTPK